MRLSTGIILSILSANVFAIEHLNGAHPGSLLARRAVVADTDDVFLQKRSGDEDQEEQARPKTSSDPNPDKEAFVYDNPAFEDYPNPDSSSIDDTGEGSTAFPVYDPSQDDEDKGGRKNVYMGIDSNQDRLSFADALGDSPSQGLGHIKKELFRAKPKLELFFTKQRALTSSEKVADQLDGGEGIAIGLELYRLFSYALKTTKNYQILYKNPIKSPFRLETPSSTPDELKQKYKSLQDDVLERIKKHILIIRAAVECIAVGPKHVIYWLEKLMIQTDKFYTFILETKSRYSDLLKQLGIFDDGRLEDLEMHMKVVEKYKFELSDRFSKIEKRIRDHRENPEQSLLLKFLSSMLKSKEHPEIESKPSGDGESGSAQPKSEASGGAQSNVVVVDDLVNLKYE
ncbi:hypothetical protein BASA50_004906 [Batrachochytrium salamandrivorans]|uniref:Uncharacterized protein n=1 Tax=Batrachochytrium salamandrivorans TaxID=1357716 RepID=A0ABQ8FE83_9FUNG|nr:hypothetical protein BASA62_006612 [Batrachochytrium salamandrivorans]KAH6577866.1 hypothetical protein BASA60_003839 [Batrachochytrium salamandrivorans]KAH6596801.1 hypothetical protein BASA50_004906 [Batrachochytrium salamandrivorans]